MLPLKGRHLFTLRFLWHANAARLPYRFLIADGQVHPQLAAILENSRETFPNLDIEYVRYSDDVDFSHFHRKLADAFGRVRTPYAMLADNDDFLAFGGLERSLDFLDRSPDYVCCGGGLAGFSVYSGVDDIDHGLRGRLNRFSYRYTPFDQSADYGSESVVERLRQGSRNWWSYYAVFRIEGLRTIWRDVVDIDFSDLQLYEFFCAMRTLTLGKAHSDASSIAYFRQYGTSLRSAFRADWVHHLLRSNFTGDFNALIDRISKIAASTDHGSEERIAEMLRGICEPWLRDFLRANYGEVQGLKQLLRRRAPAFVNWALKRRRLSARRERSVLISRLAKDGASGSYLKRIDKEIDLIDEVLTGPRFRDFIEPFRACLGSEVLKAAD
ncbi:MAG TPA: TIGR00180 family glycosyltransferase [Candidatus Elarobacter sp.]|nr:TIGR00180 family glycosyltransferase [Candidatus Elarobacter sp.]